MVRSSGRAALAAIIILAAVGGLGARRGVACSTEAHSVEWLADHAAQVIVCEIADVRSHWVGQRQRIESHVTLREVEYLKGQPARERAEITIVFPGGTVGDVTMRLCCAPELRPGQRWIMFLQPEYRTYPTAGMGQGLYRLWPDADGVERVHAADGRPIAGLNERGVPIGTTAPRPESRARPLGVEGGRISVRRINRVEHAPAGAPMSLDEFRQRIAPTLEASRGFDVSVPAGRRLEPDLTPVPLRPVPAEHRSPQSETRRGPLPERVAPPEARPLPEEDER